MEFIEFKNVTKSYGKDNELKALKKISLKIKKNELVIITGDTNSGKTTLLNLIAGIEKSTKGDVFVDDVNLSSLNEKKLFKYKKENIGFIFQSCYLFENLTVLENVLLGDKKSKDEKRAKELLRKVNLTRKKDSYPSYLSLCEKQLINILRAIIKKPKILLCDDIFTNLDEKSIIKVIDLIQSEAKKFKITVIMATYNKDVLSLANKVISLENGYLKNVKINKKKKDVKA